MRAEAEGEELVGKRPRRLARIVADPGARVVARRLVRIERLGGVPRRIGLQIEDVGGRVKRPVPAADIEHGLGLQRQLAQAWKIALDDHGTVCPIRRGPMDATSARARAWLPRSCAPWSRAASTPA